MNLYFAGAIHQEASFCAHGLEADEQHRIAMVTNPALQMMQNAAAVAMPLAEIMIAGK